MLLGSEIAHKLINSTTVLELMNNIFRTNSNFDSYKEICNTTLIGQVVVTK